MARIGRYQMLIYCSTAVMILVWFLENQISLAPLQITGSWYQFYWLPEIALMYLMGRYIPMRIPEDPERVKSILHTSAMCLCGLLLAITVVSGAVLTLLSVAMLLLPFYVGYRLETKP